MTKPEFWLRFDPSGCAHGSVRVEYVGLLPDDAHKEFTPKIADRRRRPPRAGGTNLLTMPPSRR